jgi:hypothetical protein
MSNTAANQSALFILEGQGDTERFLAPLSALEWVASCRPGPVKMSEAFIAELTPYLDTGPHAQSIQDVLDDGNDLTTGSAQNDAALMLSCVLQHYSSITRAVKAAEKMGRPLADDAEYNGCIY